LELELNSKFELEFEFQVWREFQFLCYFYSYAEPQAIIADIFGFMADYFRITYAVLTNEPGARPAGCFEAMGASYLRSV
jgi:hypothetical protein